MGVFDPIYGKGVYPEIKEDATVTTTEEFLTAIAINDYVVNDGANNITVTIYAKSTDGAFSSMAFTLKPGEKNTVPFRFDKLGYKTASSTSEIRIFAHRPY